MQSVSAAFTAEETDSVRKIAANFQVSWKKETLLGNIMFTIGVSLIGGNDVIGINPGAIGSAGNYKYTDETEYLMSLAWERGLSMPVGGLNKAMAEARLDNTDGRFLPDYMGGISEISTAILPRRPFIIGAGFYVGGVPITIPQFSGIFTRQPKILRQSREARIVASDYIDFFQNRFVDQETMFTGLRTDEVMEGILRDSLGLSTAQYDLDTGINVIPFGLFEKGTRYSDIFHQLAQAENGQFYQDEEGIYKFENRQRWDSSPYNSVSRIITTAQVIDAEAPDDDHIINVVEINSKVMAKQPEQIIFRLNPFDNIRIPAGEQVEIFLDFENPALSMTTPIGNGQQSYFVANTVQDGSGEDVTSSVTVARVDKFAKAAKIIFSNTGLVDAFVTTLVVTGRIAATERELYYRESIGASVTAYEERVYALDNPYIQSESWANSLAQLILSDFATPEKLQRITIRAIPSLQLGDMVSWQGRYWRIYNIRNSLSAEVGFIQELTMLQREIRTYFRIGISTIGGSDMIAP